MIILGLVAEMGGGKTAAADYILGKYNAERYSFGQIMADLLNRLYLPVSRNNTSQISIILRQEFGNDLFAKTMAEDIKKDLSHEIIVVESIRREEDIKYLKELPGFHLVSIIADMKTRYERTVNRREKSDDATKSYEDFVKDHQRETELSIIPLLSKADFNIDNSGSLEEFYAQLDQIIKQLS